MYNKKKLYKILQISNILKGTSFVYRKMYNKQVFQLLKTKNNLNHFFHKDDEGTGASVL